jgi:hypothetical protein
MSFIGIRLLKTQQKALLGRGLWAMFLSSVPVGVADGVIAVM